MTAIRMRMKRKRRITTQLIICKPAKTKGQRGIVGVNEGIKSGNPRERGIGCDAATVHDCIQTHRSQIWPREQDMNEIEYVHEE
jgi:hypothetical protein